MCVVQDMQAMVACLWMLKCHFGPVIAFGCLMLTFVSNSRVFQMTHFWVNVFRNDDAVANFAARSKFGTSGVKNIVVVFDAIAIGRKLTIRVMMVIR